MEKLRVPVPSGPESCHGPEFLKVRLFSDAEASSRVQGLQLSFQGFDPSIMGFLID